MHSPLLPRHSPPVSAEELWFTQRVDHLTPNSETNWKQRYFLSNASYVPGGPMFFYLGNEADVTLYLNATGLIWENADRFGALVVFAEHRYYGESQPLGDASLDNLQYLSVEQALEDYVSLIAALRAEYSFGEGDAVVGFGGSYGGMLASWARYRYPHVWDGAIAGSAPIFSFEGQGVDPNFYAEGVTYDVTEAAGAAPACEGNLRAAFEDLGVVELASTDEGRELIRDRLSLCSSEDSDDDETLGWDATFWLNTALSYMAMGNYPYPSDYILNGNGFLPAFPVRVACDALDSDLTDDTGAWLDGLAAFAGVYYNSSGTLQCNSLSAPVNPESEIVNTLWGYQYCSEIFQLFGQEAGPDDMFWDAPWDAQAQSDICYESVGASPYPENHITKEWGVEADWAERASNIVWSQGEYDPWKGGGVQTNLSSTLLSVVIPESAHHLDLFFSNEGDTDAVKAAREFEMANVQNWIDERRARGSAGVTLEM
ncbi:hypothetical protein TeGR_g1596 [Tetraparma gracilis]|uniref:Lysosomal Pro-X carboxypeptidase n=1 Tax=Tetraparma gracilis TaxID=2962635 RepID=A0ABQ6MGR1_9STRA|nr:hypothetical protein TeGR_g1596 [Tetraparma gracilis]